MWQSDAPDAELPTDFRASQMNLLLHFGKKVTPTEAREKFDIAVDFAQRYPCRIIIICTDTSADSSERPLEAKFHSECFLGADLRKMCCVEVLMLAYHVDQKNFMDNQVSVWLENDLPTYCWYVRMPMLRMKERFAPFLSRCRRMVYDSTIEADDYTAIDWSNITVVQDIANARILPLRQAIGQYLSAYSPAVIVDGLTHICIRYCATQRGEARCLRDWFRECLEQCIIQAKLPKRELLIELTIVDCKELALEVSCEYSNGKHFFWRLEHACDYASLSSNFGGGLVKQCVPVQLLSAEKALTEALFSADSK